MLSSFGTRGTESRLPGSLPHLLQADGNFGVTQCALPVRVTCPQDVTIVLLMVFRKLRRSLKVNDAGEKILSWRLKTPWTPAPG